MPFINTDIYNLETELLNSDYYCHYGTLRLGIFNSQGWNPASEASRVQEEADSPLHTAEDVAIAFVYSTT